MHRYTHYRPDIVTTGQSLASLPPGDRNHVLNALHQGDLPALLRTLSGAIADDQAARALICIHVPSWMTESQQINAWREAALSAGRSGEQDRRLARWLPQLATLLDTTATAAAAGVVKAQAGRARLTQQRRDTEARRDHYRGANVGLTALALEILTVRITQAAILLCEFGAVAAVLGMHFGLGVGISLARVPAMNRALWFCMSVAIPPLTYWIAHFIMGEVTRAGSRWRHFNLPLAITAIVVCATVLLGVRYASSVDTSSLSASLAQLGTGAVGIMSAVIGFFGSFVGAALGHTIPALDERLRQVDATEARFASEIKDVNADLGECEGAIPVHEENARMPAVAATHFEQAVINAIALLARFTTERERRLAAAEAAFQQLLALSVPDREQVDILLRTLTEARGDRNDGEAA